MKFSTIFVAIAFVISTVLAAPVPLDLSPVLGSVTNNPGGALSPVVDGLCDPALAIVKLNVAEVAHVDAFVCLAKSQPVPPEIEQATREVSSNCNVLKDSINALVSAPGLLEVRAVVCLPKVIVYVSVL
ncbi:hypothetical protein K7432_017478 [Basidiobolus ranarum]|uniref:Uncharacterized protein n=1 Tax=Basidiobolus ranarum TaxID=34480 RepID=A0ABR2VKB9_9FUNG